MYKERTLILAYIASLLSLEACGPLPMPCKETGQPAGLQKVLYTKIGGSIDKWKIEHVYVGVAVENQSFAWTVAEKDSHGVYSARLNNSENLTAGQSVHYGYALDASDLANPNKRIHSEVIQGKKVPPALDSFSANTEAAVEIVASTDAARGESDSPAFFVASTQGAQLCWSTSGTISAATPACVRIQGVRTEGVDILISKSQDCQPLTGLQPGAAYRIMAKTSCHNGVAGPTAGTYWLRDVQVSTADLQCGLSFAQRRTAKTSRQPSAK